MDLKSFNNDVSCDVLSRLPTKDLVQFKCVSKGWQRLISDPTFIQVQSQKKESLSGFFFQQRYEHCDDDIKIVNYIPVASEALKLHREVLDFLPRDVVVLASCNGLVCCRSCFPFDDDAAIYVCNPLNKEFVKINWGQPDIHDVFVLSFDPSQDFRNGLTGFKVVRVRQLETDDEAWYFSFDFYSFQTNKRELSKEICWFDNSLYRNEGIVIGESFFWLTDGDRILSFNVKTELSFLISTPFPMADMNSARACIGVSKDSKLNYVMISEHGLHVWFLEDYFESKWSLKKSKSLKEMEEENLEFLWRLQERVLQLAAHPGAWVEPLAFKDEILLMKVSNVVYLYCTESGKMKNVCEVTKFGTSSVFRPIVIPYSMSLVPLTQSSREAPVS